MQAQQDLIAKLDAFIRKYYKDRVIRGLLYSVGLIVAFFLIAALLEYFGRFGTGTRTALFWSTLAAAAVVMGRFIVVPLLKLFRLGDVISHEEAARIVGTHFTDVKDKLLNTLQLRGMALATPGQRDLIDAAIAQRNRELGPIPFVNAIDLRRNTRYLRYAIPPVAILVVLLFAAPSLITGPTKRLIAHSSEFIPEAPFRFVLENDTLEVPEAQDLEVEVAIVGQAIPQQVELEVAGQRIPMVKKGATHFTHRFRNVQDPVSFRFTAEGFHSEQFTLTTIPDPLLLDFGLRLEYPGYLGKPPETANNTGDITIPAGTRITWNINARSADALDLAFDDTTFALAPVGLEQGRGSFSATRRLLQSRTYRMNPRFGQRAARAPLQ